MSANSAEAAASREAILWVLTSGWVRRRGFRWGQMSERPLDLRRSVRRYRTLIAAVTALGLFIGAAFCVLSPPKLTSTVLVVLPQGAQASQSTTPGSGPSGYMATQIVIASSDPVLSGALPHISPAMSLQALRSEIRASSLTDTILSISATARTAAQAEATANAVASSYLSYVTSSSVPGGAIQAYILQPANNAIGTRWVKRLIIDALIGAIVGALIGIMVSLALGSTDRRLRWRDEMAASIGIPVLASVSVAHPTDAVGWAKLLEDYEPGVLQALQLRQALQHLGMLGVGANNGSERANLSLAVLSLSSDPGALALGPQLAVFAASLGIPTALVIGPSEDATAAAGLRTACAVPAPASSKRPNHLHVTISDDGDADGQSDAVLTVVVAVVDGRNPRVADRVRTTATVLGVSAGVATAEQLARAVSNAAADDREISGILVADPEPSDRTSGRIPQIARMGAVQNAYMLDRHSNGDRKAHDPDQARIFTVKRNDSPPGLSTEIKR